MDNKEKIEFLEDLVYQLNEELLEESFVGTVIHPDNLASMKKHFEDTWYKCEGYELFPWPPDYTHIAIFKGFTAMGRLIDTGEFYTFEYPIALRDCYFRGEIEALNFLTQYYEALLRKPR